MQYYDGKIPIEIHEADKLNPHDTTKSQVNLGNVTDDAQLKRTAADFTSFDPKGTPIGADVLLIEDSEDTSKKKKITVNQIAVNSITYAQHVYVDKNGNDGTGTGTNVSPFLTMAKGYAIAKTMSPSATNPIIVQIGIGTFIEANIAMDTNYISINGAGKYQTFLQTSSLGGAFISQSGIGDIKNLTITSASSSEQDIFNQSAALTPLNSVIENVDIIASTLYVDFIAALYGKAKDCYWTGGGDYACQTLNASSILENCEIKGAYDRVIAHAYGTIKDCYLYGPKQIVENVYGTARFYNTKIHCTNEDFYLVKTIADGAEFYDCIFQRDAYVDFTGTYKMVSGDYGYFSDCKFIQPQITNQSLLYVGVLMILKNCHFEYDSTLSVAVIAGNTSTIRISGVSFKYDDQTKWFDTAPTLTKIYIDSLSSLITGRIKDMTNVITVSSTGGATYTTLADAVAAVVNDTTLIVVFPGTYTEPKMTISSYNIRIKGMGAFTGGIDNYVMGDVVIQRISGDDWLFELTGEKDLILDDIDVYNSVSSFKCIGRTSGTGYVWLRHCRITGACSAYINAIDTKFAQKYYTTPFVTLLGGRYESCKFNRIDFPSGATNFTLNNCFAYQINANNLSEDSILFLEGTNWVETFYDTSTHLTVDVQGILYTKYGGTIKLWKQDSGGTVISKLYENLDANNKKILNLVATTWTIGTRPSTGPRFGYNTDNDQFEFIRADGILGSQL